MASAAGPVEQGLGRLWDSAPRAKAAEALAAATPSAAGKDPVLLCLSMQKEMSSLLLWALTSCLSHPVSWGWVSLCDLSISGDNQVSAL